MNSSRRDKSARQCRREVILAAGAIGSPHILELSGIGRGDVLQAAGIETVLERRSVGENLQDHLQTSLRLQGYRYSDA